MAENPPREPAVVRRGERTPRSRWPKPGERAPAPHPYSVEPDSAERGPPRRRTGSVPQVGRRRDGTRAGPSLVTYAIIAICVAVFFLVQTEGGRAVSIDTIYRWGFVPERLFTLGNPGALWTLVTASFLHGGLEHLVVNMIFLWSFGRIVEPWLGPVRYALLYLAAGVAGALVHGLLTGEPRVPVVGASGAIFGVFAAAVFVAPRAIVFVGPIPMPLYVALILVGALHVAALAFEWNIGIAWWAHLGGAAVGLAVAPLLKRWLTL